jgi:hypothetical protein
LVPLWRARQNIVLAFIKVTFSQLFVCVFSFISINQGFRDFFLIFFRGAVACSATMFVFGFHLQTLVPGGDATTQRVDRFFVWVASIEQNPARRWWHLSPFLVRPIYHCFEQTALKALPKV